MIRSYRRDSEGVLDLLTMVAADESSDSETEEELQLLYVEMAFSPKRRRGKPFNVDQCSEEEFEQLFR